MRNRLPIALAGAMLLAGCAATAPQSDDSLKFQASERAAQLLEEQGKTMAAMRGHDRDTDLVCERFRKVGSHITVNYCYTRAEMMQRRLQHQEKYRKTSEMGATCMEGGIGGGPVGGSSATGRTGGAFRGAFGNCVQGG